MRPQYKEVLQRRVEQIANSRKALELQLMWSLGVALMFSSFGGAAIFVSTTLLRFCLIVLCLVGLGFSMVRMARLAAEDGKLKTEKSQVTRTLEEATDTCKILCLHHTYAPSMEVLMVAARLDFEGGGYAGGVVISTDTANATPEGWKSLLQLRESARGEGYDYIHFSPYGTVHRHPYTRTMWRFILPDQN